MSPWVSPHRIAERNEGEQTSATQRGHNFGVSSLIGSEATIGEVDAGLDGGGSALEMVELEARQMGTTASVGENAGGTASLMHAEGEEFLGTPSNAQLVEVRV